MTGHRIRSALVNRLLADGGHVACCLAVGASSIAAVVLLWVTS